MNFARSTLSNIRTIFKVFYVKNRFYTSWIFFCNISVYRNRTLVLTYDFFPNWTVDEQISNSTLHLLKRAIELFFHTRIFACAIAWPVICFNVFFKRNPTARIAFWIDFSLNFEFKIFHCIITPGKFHKTVFWWHIYDTVCDVIIR